MNQLEKTMSLLDTYGQAFQNSFSGLAAGATAGYLLDATFRSVPHAVSAKDFPLALLGVIAQVAGNMVVMSEYRAWIDARSAVLLSSNELPFYFGQFATQPTLQRRIRSCIELIEYAAFGRPNGITVGKDAPAVRAAAKPPVGAVGSKP